MRDARHGAGFKGKTPDDVFVNRERRRENFDGYGFVHQKMRRAVNFPQTAATAHRRINPVFVRQSLSDKLV
jgi:hypothetical protein